MEVEGLREAVEENALHIESVCQENRARQVRRAKSAEERDLFWKGRKNAFGALGRISPLKKKSGITSRRHRPFPANFETSRNSWLASTLIRNSL